MLAEVFVLEDVELKLTYLVLQTAFRSLRRPICCRLWSRISADWDLLAVENRVSVLFHTSDISPSTPRDRDTGIEAIP